MTAATAPGHRQTRPERDIGPAFVLALMVHALLIAGLVFAVHWKSEPPAAVYAELWAPGAAPPPTVAPPPPPPTPPKAEPEPEPEKPADIVVKTEPKKVEKKPEPKKEEKKPEPRKPEPPKKIEPPKKPEPKPDPKAAEREAKAAEARHKAELARVMGQTTGPVGGSPNAVPGAGLSGGAAATYADQVIACVRPHIVFAVPDGVKRHQFEAHFTVNLLPTGELVGAPKLVKPSGLPAYDAAVERAIRRCDPFPSPRGSAPPRAITLVFDPVETR